MMAKSATHSRRVAKERGREREKEREADCQDEIDRALRWAMPQWHGGPSRVATCHSASSGLFRTSTVPRNTEMAKKECKFC